VVIKVHDVPVAAEDILRSAGVTHVVFTPGSGVTFRFGKSDKSKKGGKAVIQARDFPVALQEKLEAQNIESIEFNVKGNKVQSKLKRAK
jgi:hypothetical protein